MDYFDFNMQLSPDQFDPAEDGIPQSDLVPAVSSQNRTPVGTPAEHPRATGDIVVSVSTTFNPNASKDSLFADLILVSSDQVYFHVHCHRVLSASSNGFNSLLPPPPALSKETFPPTISVPEPADVLNVVLHTIYNMSASQFMPSFDTLSASLDALIKYGIPLQRYIVPRAPLYALLLSQAPLQPIESYALAASHSLEDLAVAISPHLLSFSLPSLTDETAAQIGPLYLKRLFFLHYGRTEALKSLLLHPPRAHSRTSACDDVQQRKLTRAWALASAHLVWDARPTTVLGRVSVLT